MAVMFTTQERQSVMSLFRQFSYPNYDDNCRAEEAWLKQPGNMQALAAFRAKFLSADALTPDAVIVGAPAPKVHPVVAKAMQPVAASDSPQSTVVKLNDGAAAPVPGNAALTPQGTTGGAAPDAVKDVPPAADAPAAPAADAVAAADAPKSDAPAQRPVAGKSGGKK